MEKSDSTSKIIKLQNGYVEIIKQQGEAINTIDSSFYKFLAKLLIEDKNFHKKNEALPFKD